MAPSAHTAPAALIATAAVVALAGCVVEVEQPAGPLTATAPVPDASPGASDAPGGAGSTSGDGYAVLMTDQETGEPVTYSSCSPVRYVTNLQGAPEGVGELVDEAVDRVAEATGLQFTDEGPTDETATPRRQPRLDRYGDGWAPVLIAWTDPGAVPALEGPPAGIGGSTSVTAPSRGTAYVTGTVYLDGPDLAELLRRPGGEAQVRSVVLHELGHLVGLDHVDDRSQLMYGATTPGVTDYQAGDLAGLQVVGNGPCIEDLPALARG